MNHDTNTLKLIRLGIDTQYEFIVYLRSDSLVYKTEGFDVYTQVQVSSEHKTIIATVNIIHSDILKSSEASLSESAWQELGVKVGDFISLSHLNPVASLKHVRAKIFGKKLHARDLDEIMQDIVSGKYSNIQLASFVTACANDHLNIDEITHLTRSMVKVGQQLHWDHDFIMDKHSVGGIPGNRTSPIVVAIVAAAGLTIPKTSSRAITSPAGTADTVETMTKVELSITQMRAVVDQEGGCLAWGGAIGISPADDIIIRVERPLDLDPVGQMIASVISKKVAVGATHVVIDIPVGPTAKIRSDQEFLKLKEYFDIIGQAVGLNVNVLKTDGFQPLGIGIGPALEAKDILNILHQVKTAPEDLRMKALLIAGNILELGKKAPFGQGKEVAEQILMSGAALEKFIAICEAQGGFQQPPTAKYTHDIVATHAGVVTEIDNRNLATVAKLAGAPHDPAGGLEFFAKLDTRIVKGQTLYRIHAETKGELEYSLAYAQSRPTIIKIKREE